MNDSRTHTFKLVTDPHAIGVVVDEMYVFIIDKSTIDRIRRRNFRTFIVVRFQGPSKNGLTDWGCIDFTSECVMLYAPMFRSSIASFRISADFEKQLIAAIDAF